MNLEITDSSASGDGNGVVGERDNSIKWYLRGVRLERVWRTFH